MHNAITVVQAVLQFLNFLKLQSCPEVVLKSQSFGTNVLILAIAVRAQWQFNVLLAALLIWNCICCLFDVQWFVQWRIRTR